MVAPGVMAPAHFSPQLPGRPDDRSLVGQRDWSKAQVRQAVPQPFALASSSAPGSSARAPLSSAVADANSTPVSHSTLSRRGSDWCVLVGSHGLQVAAQAADADRQVRWIL